MGWPRSHAAGAWRGFRGRGRGNVHNKGAYDRTAPRNATPSEQQDENTRVTCPYSAWRLYFPSEAYNPESESSDLVQHFLQFFQSVVLNCTIDEVEENGFYELDYKDLANNVLLMEAIPNMEEMITNDCDKILQPAGLALNTVLEEQLRMLASDEHETAIHVSSLPHIQIRLVNFGLICPLRSLKATYFGKFVSVRGTVARVSSIKPLCVRLAFQCSLCSAVFPLLLQDGRYAQPNVCRTPGCQSRSFSAQRASKLTSTIDWQLVRLQESLNSESSESGRIPRTIDCELTCDLVGCCVPGDMVTVSGVVKVAAGEQTKGKSKDKCTFLLNIRANSVTRVSRKRGKRSLEDKLTDRSVPHSLELTTRDLYCIQTIYEQEDKFKLLVHSLCPSIYGHEMVKAGLLLGLFGGCQKFSGSSENVTVRGDPHILVVGDPGLGKSQMLQAAAAVAPRSVYVCGNTSTSSGLTVTLCRESGSGDYSLEAGALVLADQGACCIDEFDKMGQQHQALLEAMEQQSISIAKAGIVCNLPARTSVLAAANPVGGHYNKAKTVAENLRMGGPLLSRFDLVFILLDKPDEELDNLLSSHVMALHSSADHTKHQNPSMVSSQATTVSNHVDSNCSLRDRLRLQPGELLDPLPPPLLRKYICYAKDYVHPKLSKDAAKVIQNFYMELRLRHHSSDSTPITTRQLESLVRLTEARAKMELREVASDNDALDVIAIMKFSMVDTYSDEAGQLDFSRSQNGSGMSVVATGKKLIALMQDHYRTSYNSLFTLQEIRLLAQKYKLVIRDMDTLIDSLNHQGFLLKKGNAVYQLQTVC